LVSHIHGRTQAEGFWEEGAEEDILALEGESNRRLQKST
jgi:hypothetical protein